MPADQGHAIPWSRALPARKSNTVFARFPEAVLQFGGDGTIAACNSAADTLIRQIEGSIHFLKQLRALADDAQSTRAAASNTIEWTFGGQTRHMLASAMPADDAAAFIICRDTTVETTMRLALIDSRQRSKDLVEISSDFAWATDQGLSILRVQIALFEAKLSRAESAAQFSKETITENTKVAASIEADKEAAQRRFILEEQKRQFLFESAIQTAISYNSTGLSVLLQDVAAFNFGFDV